MKLSLIFKHHHAEHGDPSTLLLLLYGFTENVFSNCVEKGLVVVSFKSATAMWSVWSLKRDLIYASKITKVAFICEESGVERK